MNNCARDKAFSAALSPTTARKTQPAERFSVMLASSCNSLAKVSLHAEENFDKANHNNSRDQEKYRSLVRAQAVPPANIFKTTVNYCLKRFQLKSAASMQGGRKMDRQPASKFFYLEEVLHPRAQSRRQQMREAIDV